MPPKMISLVIPVYNEEKNIPLLYEGLKKVWQGILYNQEMIYVDDGSSDDSSLILRRLSALDSAVKVVEFSRNFGKEIATTAGINHCQGNACILIDADLQHPLAMIPEFLRRWEKGAEIVVGVRLSNKSCGLMKSFCSRLFYKIMAGISEVELMPNSTDFRLLDRKVINEFNRFTEKNRITRGLIDWLGFKKDYLYFDAGARANGEAGYSFLKLVRLAINSVVSLSLFPLKLAGYLGIFITITSGLLGLFILVEKYLLNDPWKMYFSGSAILAVVILFLVGIILICLGLTALYIANIHGEVVNRPLYAVRNKINIEQSL
jgi:polyisoprenyl-phosphate glycosyltransferase